MERTRRQYAVLTVRLRGVCFRFSFWFFAVVALFALLDAGAMVRYAALPILVHELGHLLVLHACGGRVRELSFTPVSVDMVKDGRALSYHRELLVALGGVAANFLAAFLLWRFRFPSLRNMLLVAVNIAVALFNLLPVGDLDGGQAVRILCTHWFSPDAAYNISRVVSFLVLTPLFALSILLILRETNFTLAACCIYLALCVIVRD